MLYAVDRMLDARLGAMHLQEERHRFHGVNRSFFVFALACAVPVLIALLTHMETPLLHAYLLLGVALAGYFALIHTPAFAHRIPKEFAVGVIFIAAIFMPELLAGELHALWPVALCFGGLCWLNCILIYQREHATLLEAHWSTRFAIQHASLLLASLGAAGVLLFFSGEATHALSLSVTLSALGMMALHRMQGRMGRLNLRIAADAALLTPLIFLLR